MAAARDVFVADYLRTPIGRYGGALAGVRADDLAAMPIRALLARNPGLDPASIDDVYLGDTNQAGEDNRNVARMAALLAGLPDTVPGCTVNRLCGSGMEALSLETGETCAMSVNVSPVQVRSDHLFAELERLRADRGSDLSLCFEMTEQHMIDDTAATLERLNRLVDFGIELAVDDFGTGYSSLAMLHQVPARVLKIDRDLVSQVGTPSGRAVLAAVVGVAHAYAMRTVAEGVETVDEALALRNLGIENLQGFLFAPAEPIDQIVRRATDRDWPWDVDADALT